MRWQCNPLLPLTLLDVEAAAGTVLSVSVAKIPESLIDNSFEHLLLSAASPDVSASNERKFRARSDLAQASRICRPASYLG